MSQFEDAVRQGVDPASLRVFGVEIQYLPQSGDAYPVTAILGRGPGHEEKTLRMAFVLRASEDDEILCLEADPVKGDRVEINDAITYAVFDTDPQADGDGWYLTLQRV